MAKILSNPRGGPKIPFEPIEDLLMALSDLVMEIPEVAECDMNPILASSLGVITLDARIVLAQPNMRVVPACRPYPMEYVKVVYLPSGEKVVFRPIRTEDCAMMTELHERLSALPAYKEIFHHELFADRLVSEEMIRLCWSSFDRRSVFVVEREEGQRRLAGVGVLQRRVGGTASLWHVIDEGCAFNGLREAFIGHLRYVAEQEGVVVKT